MRPLSSLIRLQLYLKNGEFVWRSEALGGTVPEPPESLMEARGLQAAAKGFIRPGWGWDGRWAGRGPLSLVPL